MTREDAIRQTLGMLNPDGIPHVVDVRLTTRARIIAAMGTDLMLAAVLEADDHAMPVYVVTARQQVEPLFGNNPAYGATTFTVVFKAETGEMYTQWSSDENPRLPKHLGSLEAWATLGPPLTLTPWPTQQGVVSPVPAAPTPTPDHARVPHGRPFKLSEASASVRAALTAFPLLPGNAWTYRHNWYDDNFWRGEILTRTVRSAELFGPDLVLIRERVTHSPKDGAPGIDWEPPDALQPFDGDGDAYAVLWRDELYRSDNPDEVVKWLEHFGRPGPVPTMVSCENVHDLDAGCYVPDMRLPVVVGRPIPIPGTGSYWDWQPARPIRTPAGMFDDCLEASTGGIDDHWRLFCPGIGIVRSEWVHTSYRGYWSVMQLIDRRLDNSVASPQR